MQDTPIKKRVAQTISMSMLLLGLTIESTSASDNDIAIVHSYAPNITWVVNQRVGFQKALGDNYKYTEFNMDTKRIDESEFASVASDILENLKKLKPSLIYVTDDNALKLVGRYVNPKTPVVFSGVNAHLREDYPWLRDTTNITGVLERPLVKRNLIESMNAFNIKADKILVLMDMSLTSQYFFKLDLNSQESFSVLSAQVNVHRSEKFSSWKDKILSSKQEGYDLLLIVGAFALKNDDGSIISVIDVAKWVSQHSPITPFTSHLQQIGKGLLVGGLQLNGEIMGMDAGNIAKSILIDKLRPDNIFPKTQKAGDLKYSKSEIIKRGLTISPRYKDLVILMD